MSFAIIGLGTAPDHHAFTQEDWQRITRIGFTRDRDVPFATGQISGTQSAAGSLRPACTRASGNQRRFSKVEDAAGSGGYHRVDHLGRSRRSAALPSSPAVFEVLRFGSGQEPVRPKQRPRGSIEARQQTLASGLLDGGAGGSSPARKRVSR